MYIFALILVAVIVYINMPVKDDDACGNYLFITEDV